MGISYRGGKPVSRPSPRRSIPKGGISYRGGKPITRASPIAGVSVGKYQAVVPFMQASYVTAGMPGMTAKSIAMFTKAATMPSQLTHSERVFVRQHMPSMKPEYREKFVEFERKLTQAELKEKLTERKKKIEKPDIKRRVASIYPGVATGLLYAATPATLKAMWTPKIPTIIKAGERVGIEAVKLQRWSSEEQTAPVKAMEAMYPSYVVGAERYEEKATAFETKWTPYTKGEYFTGTESEYKEYLGKHEEVRREGAQLGRQYEAFGQLETQAEREEKGRYWGLEEPYKRKVKKPTREWVAERTPSIRELKTSLQPYGEPIRKITGIEVREGYPVTKGGREMHEYTAAMYAGFREEPLKMAVTTAVFAALPPVLKGAKYVGKAARFAPAAKWVQPVSFTLKKGIPKVTRLAAVKVGVEKGILPSSARFIPKVAGYGMGATYAGVMGSEMYVTPPSERAYKLGRMTTTEIAPMMAGTYIGVKAPAMLSGAARTARILALRKKLKMKDLTPEQIASAKQQILYIEKGVKPSEFLESAYEAQYEYGMPTRHLTPEQYAKVRIKTGKLGGVYDVTFPAEKSEYLGMHLSPKHMKGLSKADVVATAEWLGMPRDIDPLKSQIMIAKGLRQARLEAQMRLGKQYIEFVAREKELPIITKEAREAWEYTHRKYGQIRAHELFHERYRTASEERVLALEKQYAAARGKGKKLFPVGEEMEPGVKVWKMMDVDWGKQTVILRSHFEMPGGYVSPQAQPFFLRIGRQKTKWELFGSEFPTSEMGARPTAARITLEDIARLPKKVRETRDPYSMTAYALGKAEPGKAYVTWPIELGTKLESEFAIAPTTGMKWTPSPTGKEYYTTWKHRAIPIEHYEWFETGMKRPEIGLEAGKYFVKRPRATAIIETKKGIVLHPGERGEGLILPGGGIETAAEVAAKKGAKVVGERAAEAAMREVHEELGVKTSGISKRLFKYKSTETPVYSRGRQKWYSKSYHDVFAVDIIGKPKPVSREVSKVVYWKPGSKAKLSKDTEAILKEYMAAKKQRSIPKEPITKERMKRIVSKAEQRKERIQKGEPKTFEESLKYEEYGVPTQKRAALISPLGLGVEYGIKEITRGSLPYTTLKYEKGISEVAYPKYPRKYTKEAYPKRVPYSKRAQYKKPKPYKKPVPTKYPKPVPTKYPKPEHMKYPKPVPQEYPKPVPEPVPYPKPTPRKIPPPPPLLPPEVPPPPIIFELELPTPKLRKKARAQKQPYAWRVKNPIPELQQMFTQEMQRGGPKLL